MNPNHLFTMQQAAEQRVRLRQEQERQADRHRFFGEPIGIPLGEWMAAAGTPAEGLSVPHRAPADEFSRIPSAARRERPAPPEPAIGGDGEQTFLWGLVALLTLNGAPLELIAALVYLAL